jgi:uncharacterized protein (DUF433 family)
MEKTAYVENRDGGYWVTGSRVSLDSIIYAFLNGETAESIVDSFPVLRLEQVYGAITFYLAHRSEIDTYLEQARAEFQEKFLAAQESDPDFYRRLAHARRLRQIAV